MPTLLSFILATLGTLGFLAGFYFIILTVFGIRNRGAKPSMTILPGGRMGTIGVRVEWNEEVYAVQIWRIRFRFFSPERLVKDSQFTVTFENPQKKSFFIPIELPPSFKELIESNNQNNRAIISVEARGVENFVMGQDFRLPKIQKIYHSSSPKFPETLLLLPEAKEDTPAITSLDHSELVIRKSYLKNLAAAAKAKAKPAAAAPQKPVVPMEKTTETPTDTKVKEGRAS